MATKRKNKKSNWIRIGLVLVPIAILIYFSEKVVSVINRFMSSSSPDTVTIFGADYRGKMTTRNVPISQVSSWTNNQVRNGFKWFRSVSDRSNWISRVNKELGR